MITFYVTSLVYSDAPTSSTASTRSVTFGSMFNIQCSIFNSKAPADAIFSTEEFFELYDYILCYFSRLFGRTSERIASNAIED